MTQTEQATKRRSDGATKGKKKTASATKRHHGKKAVITALFACVTLWHAGCLKPNTQPIERGINTLMSEVVKPAVEKAADELSTRTAQMQGQGSLINPGYTVKGFASAGPATTFEFTIRAEGVSANLAAAAQADAGQPGSVPPPAVRGKAQPAAQPSP